MKKNILFIFLILLTILASSCKGDKNIMEKYPSLKDESHIIKELSGKELIEKIANQESFVVLLGFEACPWCQALVPEYNAVGKKLEFKEIYYLDIKDMRDNPDSNDKIYYESLYSYFNEVIDKNNDRINAPTVLGVKDGKLVGYLIDTVPSHVKNDLGILPPLTTTQKNELHLLLEDIFNKTKN